MKVYDSIETNQVFGAPEVKKILGCTITASIPYMALKLYEAHSGEEEQTQRIRGILGKYYEQKR